MGRIRRLLERLTPRTGVGCAGLLLLLMVFMAGVTLAFSPILWDTWGNVQVVGRLVDGTTGAPIAGARVMTLERARDAGRKALVDQRWAQGDKSTASQSTWLSFGTGSTDDEGRFDVRLRTQWGGNGGLLSRLLRTTDIKPYQGAHALLVRTGAGQQFVLDLTEGRWVVEGARGPDEVYARIDVGERQLTQGN